MRHWVFGVGVLWGMVAGCGDDGSSPMPDTGVEEDAGPSDGGSADAPGCTADAECDDGIFCNGAETCTEGSCAAGTADCDDGIDCTADACDEDARTCAHLAPDADGDGHGDAACEDGAGMPLGDDCDDADAARHPGAAEVCDGDDEDCDPATLGDRDLDGDGVPDSRCCNARADGVRVCGDDCNDVDRGSGPASPEICDATDNDCDGRIDERGAVDGFADEDHDLHGDPLVPRRGCAGTPGLSPIADDCDDADPSRHGGQLEVCNSRDDDCDGSVDEETGSVTWYRDVDGDGFGSAGSGTMRSCTLVAGHSLLDTDCDDADRSVHPAAAESCNAADDDCNGRADFAPSPGDFEDDDDDGVPDAACAPAGTGDCDDADPTVGTGAPEIVDGIDNDCDGTVDGVCRMATWYVDADGDGWGDESMPTMRSCDLQPGRVTRGGDCNDAEVAMSPGEREICNGVDDDCDGESDDFTGGSCYLDHALGECRAGTCAIRTCERLYADCDATAPGCEASIADDPSNCGRCGVICTAGTNGDPACLSGRCGYACHLGYGDCDGALANGCETDVYTALDHCGMCRRACLDRPSATRACTLGACGITCAAGSEDCNGMLADGCEVRIARDAANCGGCGMACSPGDICLGSSCRRPIFASDGSDGALTVGPGEMRVLEPRIHRFTTITIGAGAVVTTTASGVLELYASGDVSIAGRIDVSGGRGGDYAEYSTMLSGAGSGGGGATGNPLGVGYTYRMAGDPICGPPGGGGGGTRGNRAPDAAAGCGEGGAYGGGAGSRRNWSAGGGGGYAGGGGASFNDNGPLGGSGASHPGSTGGVGGGDPDGPGGPLPCRPAGGGAASAPYAGADGRLAGCWGGGGGGSIGEAAAVDLAAATTFQVGSGGGGGSIFYRADVGGGGGGGGGGGALRISSATRIVVAATGELRANGGEGGSAAMPMMTAGGGGGGSGGLIYLAAPAMQIDGLVSAIGGAGGSAGAPHAGGAGGIGRIRLSVLPSECTIRDTFSPALAAGCAPATMAGRVYIATYPD